MKKALFVGNIGFNLFHFRLPLMEHLKQQGWAVAAVADDGADYARQLHEKGIRFLHIDIDHKGKNPFKDLAFTKNLKRLYRQESPDLVHHFTTKPVIFGSMAAKWAGIPNIVNTITGLGYIFQSGRILTRIGELLFRVALDGKPKTIFQNRDHYGLFISKGIVKRKNAQVILGSGVNTDAIRPPEMKISHDGIRYLMVSRMLWTKGVREFVEAAKKIKKRFPDTAFVMAGGASSIGGARRNPEAIPEAWLKNVNFGGAVRWVGRVPFKEVLALLDETDVVALPSYSEGLPKSLIEAAAKGKPIVTTDAPGCREVVANGINGFLVPAMNVHLLAERFIDFIRNPEIIDRMGAASRQLAVERFDEKRIIEQTIKVYGKTGSL